MMKINLIIIALVIAFFQSFPVNAGTELNYDEIENLLSEGRLNEAEAILNKVAENNDKDPVVLVLLGELYCEKGDRNKAIKFLNKAISLDPKYPIPHFYRGKTLFLMQKLDEAAEDFNLFMKKMRPLVKSSEEKSFYIARLHEISHIYFSFKRYEEAKKVIDEVLSIDPNDQTATYNTGIYYYVYERNRPTAYQYFSRAAQINANTRTAGRARYAIEFMRTNPDPRIEPDFDFLDRE